MKWSHSKLSCILSCPMTYYLSYVQGISQKVEKPALAIGSAVHWGIEHNTEDLTDYFNQSFRTSNAYSKDQLLAEAMVHGYLKHKDEIFDKILTDKDGSKATLLDETHELYVTGKVQSKHENLVYDFVGIVDLLLLTDKGFIVIDYKTSSYEPDWTQYLEQIYRYIMLIQSNFPDVPIYKIGIINIRKTSIRQKKSETEFEFLQRMKFEYEVNDEAYVNYHEYDVQDLDMTVVHDYIENLSTMCDVGYTIDKNKLWYINYGATKNQYGRSPFYDIIYKTPGAETLYNISDTIWDEDASTMLTSRDCVDIDMQVIDLNKRILNKFSIFKEEWLKFSPNNILGFSDDIRNSFFNTINKIYITNQKLLEGYWITLQKQ